MADSADPRTYRAGLCRIFNSRFAPMRSPHSSVDRQDDLPDGLAGADHMRRVRKLLERKLLHDMRAQRTEE